MNKENIIETIILSHHSTKEQYPFLKHKINHGVLMQSNLSNKAEFKKFILEIIDNLKPLNETDKIVEMFKQKCIPIQMTQKIDFDSMMVRQNSVKSSLSHTIFEVLMSDLHKYAEVKSEIESILKEIGLESYSYSIDTFYDSLDDYRKKEINISAKIINQEKFLTYFGSNISFLEIPLSFANLKINIQNTTTLLSDSLFLELKRLLKEDNLLLK